MVDEGGGRKQDGEPLGLGQSTVTDTRCFARMGTGSLAVSSVAATGRGFVALLWWGKGKCPRHPRGAFIIIDANRLQIGSVKVKVGFCPGRF